MAGFLGCAPSEVLDLPAVDLDLLSRYWTEEPWGSWRDNLHAAIIARELRVGRTRKNVPLDDFMLMHPDRRRRKHLVGFVDALKAMAGGKRVHISEYRPPKRGKRGSSKTRRPAGGPISPVLRGTAKGKR